MSLRQSSSANTSLGCLQLASIAISINERTNWIMKRPIFLCFDLIESTQDFWTQDQTHSNDPIHQIYQFPRINLSGSRMTWLYSQKSQPRTSCSHHSHKHVPMNLHRSTPMETLMWADSSGMHGNTPRDDEINCPTCFRWGWTETIAIAIWRSIIGLQSALTYLANRIPLV